MIEMGAAAGSTSVVVENLKLDGTVQAGCTTCATAVSGIYNGNATDGSYVSGVNFYGIGAISGTQTSLTTGLLIDTGAVGSGPYSQLDFSGGSSTNCPGSLTCLPRSRFRALPRSGRR